MLLVASILTLGVILVNGWTDAPNAIATCVSTKAIGVRKAIVMAAIFNFFGVLVMTSLNHSVAMTIYNMVDFGGDAHLSLIALCAAMAAIVIWATAAWYFGIPTSESHALIAGLSGAAVAIQNSFSGINGREWVKVIYGIVLSTVLGFLLGFLSAKLTVLIFRNKNRLKSEKFFSGAQVAGGAAMAFMHGAQDGQKFMAIFLLGAAFSSGQTEASTFNVPIWLMVVCSLVMGLGTSIGGYRIIKSVGMDMVKTQALSGLCGGFLRHALPAFLFAYGYSRQHNAYENDFYNGRRRGAENEQCKLGYSQGPCADMGLHIPGMRTSRIYHGKAVFADIRISGA